MRHWSFDAVFYHIYPLGMCGAPEHNDFCSAAVSRLKEVEDWIPHMKSLGVNAIYIGPLFESTKHGYDTVDYFHVDRRLGTNEDLKNLSAKLHENGIRVVLDGVFNHSGRDFFAFKDIQHNRGGSQYQWWYNGVDFNKRSPCGDSFSYNPWAGCYDLVKYNLKNGEVVNHLLAAVTHWIKEFNIDGIRLDAADSIDFDFFKALKNHTKSLKSDFWLMGEVVHGDYNRWANGEMLDSTTNYECYKGMYSSMNDKNMFEIGHSLKRQFGNGGAYKGMALYSFLDNHDVNRIGSTLKNKKDLYPLYGLLFTMPGAPSIYYGSEFGIEGKRGHGTDKELRPRIRIDELGQMAKELGLADAIRKFTSCRKKSEALRYGGYDEVKVESELLIFKREHNGEKVYVAINISENWKEVSIKENSNVLNDILNNDEKSYKNGAGHNISVPPKWIKVMRAE